MEEISYFAFSFLVAILAVFSFFAARNAMNKGLTYSNMYATLWALGFIALARIWHSTRELLELSHETEFIEYLFYLIAYVSFFLLMRKANKVVDDDTEKN